jgi:hypothetical protein
VRWPGEPEFAWEALRIVAAELRRADVAFAKCRSQRQRSVMGYFPDFFPVNGRLEEGRFYLIRSSVSLAEAVKLARRARGLRPAEAPARRVI